MRTAHRCVTLSGGQGRADGAEERGPREAGMQAGLRGQLGRGDLRDPDPAGSRRAAVLAVQIQEPRRLGGAVPPGRDPLPGGTGLRGAAPVPRSGHRGCGRPASGREWRAASSSRRPPPRVLAGAMTRRSAYSATLPAAAHGDRPSRMPRTWRRIVTTTRSTTTARKTGGMQYASTDRGEDTSAAA